MRHDGPPVSPAITVLWPSLSDGYETTVAPLPRAGSWLWKADSCPGDGPSNTAPVEDGETANVHAMD